MSKNDNLKDFTAPDNPTAGGLTVAATMRISAEHLALLDSLPPSRSYHARQAFTGYLSEYEKLTAIAAQLGVLPGEAIAECIRRYHG